MNFFPLFTTNIICGVVCITSQLEQILKKMEEQTERFEKVMKDKPSMKIVEGGQATVNPSKVEMTILNKSNNITCRKK